MKKYYYAGLTCPSCRYPFRNDNLSDADSFEQTKDGYFLCPICGAEFINSVNRDLFTEPVTRELPFSGGSKFTVPLYRECVPSKIEEAYVKWFSEFPSGIHLITWPWKEVRFIPVAICELLEKHPYKKIVVTGLFQVSGGKGVNNPVKLISELFSVDVPEDSESSKSRYLLPKPDRMKQHLFKKYENEIEVRIQTGRSVAGPSSSILRYEQGRLATVRKKILSRLREEYGDNWRGCSVSPEPEKPVPSEKLSGNKLEKKLKEYNELMGLIHPDIQRADHSTSSLKVTFHENNLRYAGSNVRYKLQWMNTVVDNADTVKYCQDILSPEIYESANLPDSLTSTLTYIIPDSNDYKYPSRLFETIRSLHPDMLIITDTDSFRTYSKHGFASINQELLSLVKACDIPAVMFATDSEARQYYLFDNPKRRFGNKDDVIIHTIDSQPVLDNVSLPEADAKTPYSPFFSHIGKTSTGQEIPFEFRHYDGVDVSILMEKIQHIPERTLADMLKIYINSALLSPADIENPDNPRCSLTIWINGITISYRWLYDELYEKSYDEEIYDDILTAFTETFHIFEENKNPLRDMFADTADELVSKNKSCKILFAVAPYEIKSFEEIVQTDERFTDIRKSISVVSWKNLEIYLRNNRHTSVSGIKQDIYVVSAHHPTQYFHFNRDSLSMISRIIFIADSDKEIRIRKVIEKRLIDDTIIRPVIVPAVSGDVPDFLNSVIRTLDEKDFCISKAEELTEALADEDEVYYRSDGRHTSYIPPPSDDSDDESGFGVNLQAGETVILVRDEAGRGVFLSLDSSVMVDTEIPFEEWNLKSLKKSGPGKLERSTLILSMSSYKRMFSKHMLEHHAEFQARDTAHDWTSFDDLYMDSTLWIRFIESAIENFMKYCDISRKTATDEITRILSEGTGKDQMTIRSWLRKEDMETSAGVYSLYQIEHPRSVSDVLKIHSVLSEKYVPDITAEDMERSFCAARYIQKLRGDVRKINPKDSAVVVKIREELHAVWKDILHGAVIFRPVTAEMCTLDKAVYAKKVYNEYIDYIRN